MRVLLLEDDALIGDGLVAGLGHHGFVVDWFRDGAEGCAALGELGRAPYEVAVLDLSLPGMDGLSVLAAWRRQGWDTPVLILTARDSVGDRVDGLDRGADDYLVKPFALVELVARLRALQRRRQVTTVTRLEHDGLVLDPRARQAWRNDVPMELTARELALLELLLRNKGRPLSRRQIEDSLYGWGQELDSNAVEVHIHHLRKKLGNAFIRTVRGIGYSLGEAR
ncbi:winged helix-turn-helix domain-containing protein [Paludibacterium yongneupense]|uniref:winged helix-turn-helix domain-containing protein n=1 Tax=Paludibacterium yongneupense TaxID=400061 RepID=UPI0003F57517|nr:winged helix-turn-helix domain-containing protein [Paludibacterium yongneupense]